MKRSNCFCLVGVESQGENSCQPNPKKSVDCDMETDMVLKMSNHDALDNGWFEEQWHVEGKKQIPYRNEKYLGCHIWIITKSY